MSKQRNGIGDRASPSGLCDVSEIAALLNVSGKTIYYWAGRNEIPFLRVGKHLRFDAENVLRYFREKTEEAKHPPCVPDPHLLLPRGFSRSLKTKNTPPLSPLARSK